MPAAKTHLQAAEQLGVTTRQFQNWLNEPWFPHSAKTPGGWDIDAIAAARDAQGLKGGTESVLRSKLRDARAAEQLKRDRLRTQRDELALRRETGELIPRAALELFASTLLTELGDWCETLPVLAARLVPRTAAKRVREKLKSELDQRRQLVRQVLEDKAREFDQLQQGGDPSA